MKHRKATQSYFTRVLFIRFSTERPLNLTLAEYYPEVSAQKGHSILLQQGIIQRYQHRKAPQSYFSRSLSRRISTERPLNLTSADHYRKLSKSNGPCILLQQY